MVLKRQFGKNIIIYGTMASGKSIELIRHLHIYDKFAKKFDYQLHIFKPVIDTRKFKGTQTFLSLSSRLGVEFNKHITLIHFADEILEYFKKFREGKHVIAIDEIQLFDSGIIKVIKKLTKRNHFPTADRKASMEDIIDVFDPESRIHLRAVCEVCGDDADFVQRLLNGKPAPYFDKLIVIGDKEIGRGKEVRSYEARCKKHFKIPFKQEFYLARFMLAQGIPPSEIAKLISHAHEIIDRVREEGGDKQLELTTKK